MSAAKKSIDGLVISQPNKGGQLGLDAKRPVKKPAKKVAKTAKSGGKNGQKNVVKSTTRRTAAEDFLKPVQSFDFDSDDVEKMRKSAKNEKKTNKKAKKEPGYRKNGKKKWSRKKKIIVGIVLFLLAGLIAAGIWAHLMISKMTNGESGLFDAIIAKDVPLKTDENGRTNILVFGTSGYEMSGSGHDGAQLTDSIMVVSLDQETKDVAMISIPRDLKVKMACSAGKVNEVYWCNNQSGNDEKAGAAALQKQMEDVLGISMQYYVHLDWGALVQIVDSVGGVTVTLDENINDSWTKTYIKAGVPTALNGEEALGLARARHGTAGGDFTRGNSQQKIIVALVNKVMEQGLGITNALSMVNALGDNLRMNFSTDEIRTLANLGKDFNLENMRQVPLVDVDNGVNLVTTGMVGGVSFVLPTAGVSNYKDIQAYIKQQLSSDPAVREAAAIEVLNGSGVSGTAATEQEKLEKDGYKVARIGDAPKGSYEGYQVYVVNEEMSATKSALEKRYNVEAKSASEIPAGISTKGYDIIIIVGKTTTSD